MYHCWTSDGDSTFFVTLRSACPDHIGAIMSHLPKALPHYLHLTPHMDVWESGDLFPRRPYFLPPLHAVVFIY